MSVCVNVCERLSINVCVLGEGGQAGAHPRLAQGSTGARRAAAEPCSEP